MNAYDKFLDYLFANTTAFHAALFQAMVVANLHELNCLANGFPEEVHAYKVWNDKGPGALLAKCSLENYLAQRIRRGELEL